VVDAPCTFAVAGGVVEVHPVPGHTRDGAAYLFPAAGVLCPGDYLSDTEPPSLGSGGSAAAYAAALDLLEGLLPRVRRVVPGHGTPTSPDEARDRVRSDRRGIPRHG
jgi:glyoxylase-like metal-dependent hydrolase (beta-lactamase superfamily II)